MMMSKFNALIKIHVQCGFPDVVLKLACTVLRFTELQFFLRISASIKHQKLLFFSNRLG